MNSMLGLWCCHNQMASTLSFKQKQTCPERIMTGEASNSFTCTRNPNCFVPNSKAHSGNPVNFGKSQKRLSSCQKLGARTATLLRTCSLNLPAPNPQLSVNEEGQIWSPVCPPGSSDTQASWGAFPELLLLPSPQKESFTSDCVPKHFRNGTSSSCLHNLFRVSH